MSPYLLMVARMSAGAGFFDWVRYRERYADGARVGGYRIVMDYGT